MAIEIAKDTEQKIERISQTLGIGKQQLVDRAILLYLENIRSFAALKDELKAWDTLSDEALRNFETSL